MSDTSGQWAQETNNRLRSNEQLIRDFCDEKIVGRIMFKHPEHGFGLMENKQVVWFKDEEKEEVCVVFGSVENLLKSDWKFVSYEPK